MRKGARKSKAVIISLLAAFAVVGGCDVHDSGTLPAESEADANDRLLAGIIDFHVHAAPDMEPRSIDAIDLARSAKAHGMRGIVLKNHFVETAGLAFIAREEVPGIEVFGGIVLNRTVGGINAAAVENMAQITGGYGKLVWFPTRDAEADVAEEAAQGGEARPFVSVARNGELLAEVKEVIGIIAKHQLVLATGHSSPEEGLLLLAEGQQQGVKQMVVTHGTNTYSVEQMQQVTKLGGMIEAKYSALGIRPDSPSVYSVSELVQMIREVGVDWIVLVSDLGQPANPPPTEGFGEYLAKLEAAGLTPQELKKMTLDNPAKLLGLEEAGGADTL